jgi:hypothetical protein
VSIVIDLGEQLRWMHVGEHKSCLTLTGSKGGVCRIICNTILYYL